MNFDLVSFISQYGYLIMVPLMIVEGPIATLISAFLAATGIFSWPIVLFLSITSDLVSDAGFYFLGKKFGLKFVKGPGRFLGMSEDLVNKIKKYFTKHGGETICIVKSTTGLCQITFTTAGMIGMDFKKFMKYAFWGGIVWSSFLVFVGYFYGYLWREIGQYIKEAGIAIFISAVATIILINVFKYVFSKRVFK